MLTSAATLLFALTATLASTSPTPRSAAAASPLQNFLLVTTPQRASTTNSSTLPSVSATSLFDPYDQQTYLLRTIAAGYGSLPTFNLTNGDLHTAAVGPEGVGNYVYNSTGTVVASEELQLSPGAEPAGNLGLLDGYLLAVEGEGKGWTICDGALEQHVIYWKGNASTCTPTYIHAVKNAPY